MDYDSILFYAQICARNRNISLTALNKLSRLCRDINDAVQPRLVEFKKIRDKLAIPFGAVLRNKIIGHPFNYTGKLMKIINIPDALLTSSGIALLNVDPVLFTDEFLLHTRVAFTDISLIGPKPVDFKFILFVNDDALLVIDVFSTNWTCITPESYIIYMNLPTRYNPITLGDPILSPNLLHFCFTQHIYKQENGYGIEINRDFMIDTFTKAIVRFKTVNNDAYDWTKYGLMFDGETNSHPNTTSLIRPLIDL